MSAEPDAVSLKVDFRNPHRDLVALAHELVRAFAWRVGHLGDVQKPSMPGASRTNTPNGMIFVTVPSRT